MAARPSSPDPAPDDLIDGRYRLVEFVARGGSATVWRGHDERLSRMVAIKLLAGDDIRRRGRQEARALARLSHPHIGAVFDYGDHDGRAYLVLELVDGRSLADVLVHRELPPTAAIAVAAQTAAALAAAHARGLVHRDVTPGNIMLTPNGVKLIDFGISAVDGDTELDADGGLRGTPSFAAPERLTGNTVEPPSDMYSFGVVLYRMLAGRLPWTTPGTPADPALLPDLDDVPAAVSELCLRCLQRDPAARPSATQATKVLQDLASADALTDFAATTVDDVGAHTRILGVRPADKPSAGRRAGRLAALAGLAAAIWVAGWAVLDWGPSGQPAAHQAIEAQAAPPVVHDASGGCAATYQLLSDDGRTFQATVTVAAATEPLYAGWQLALGIPDGQDTPIRISDPGWDYADDTLRSTPQHALTVGENATLHLSGRHSGPNPMPAGASIGNRTCSLLLVGLTSTSPAPQVVAVTEVKSKPDPPKGSSRSNGGGKRSGPRG